MAPDTPPPLAPYRSPDAREARLDELAAALGAQPRTLGHSTEGRPIRAVRVPATGAEPLGSVLVCANIHGIELIATEVALGLLAALQAPDEALARLWHRAHITVVPSVNPDGYARTWAQHGEGVLPELRRNARGVDLNRNFPMPGAQRPVLMSFGGWRTGSDQPGNAFYRGTSPLSEPETAAVARLLEAEPFRASVSLHSTMGALIPPCVTEKRHDRAYRSLCKAFARHQKGPRYRTLASFALDRFTGEQEDYQHHVHDTWAVCVEHYPLTVDTGRFLRRPLFWRFNPRDPGRWVDNDLPGIVAFFEAALALGPPSAL